MDNENKTYKYFTSSAKEWVEKAYDGNQGHYPTARHRNRIVIDEISKRTDKNLKILDIGCGGGNLCVALGKKGHTVIGVDQSPEMLDIAKEKMNDQDIDVTFIKSEFKCINKILKDHKFDVIIAMGFIGYLDSDSLFFNGIKNFLPDGGLLFLSCRNRLFNMNPTSLNFKKELTGGKAKKLVGELLEQTENTNVNISDVKKFIRTLKKHLEIIESNIDDWYFEDLKMNDKISNVSFIPPVTARQHTPDQISSIAEKHNFKGIAIFGFHPHILQPFVANILSRRVFNEISDSLCVFESDPISLTWSSGFIATFKKSGVSN